MKLRYPVIALLFAITMHHLVGVIGHATKVAEKARAYDSNGCAEYERALLKIAEYKLPVKGE